MAVAAAAARHAQSIFQRGLPLLTRTAQNEYAPVAKWILTTSGMVVGMIHVGGITRLTGSGLSMTSWSPLGSLPPLSNGEWTREFDRYKTFPEWQQRKSMTLSDFQFIYAWEYGHRMLGRCVGVVFCVPWLYFSLRKRIPQGFQQRMLGLVSLGASQGLVGWWMVKSGLGEDRRGDSDQIRVKPLRLATHLTLAFATYGALLWTGLDILGLPQTKTVKEMAHSLPKGALPKLNRLRLGGMAMTGWTLLTIVSGAMVAGNDAGRAFNTFPKMGDDWIPQDVFNTYARALPLYRTVSEDTATVQFHHRIMGMTTAAAGMALMVVGGAHRASLTPQVQRGLYAVGLTSFGQMSLGIVTLLSYAPIPLAALHQLGSVIVFTSGIYVVHGLRYARPALVRAAGAAVSKAPAAGQSSKVILK